jgi:hypothetical protein
MRQQRFCNSCYLTCPLSRGVSISQKEEEKKYQLNLRVFFITEEGWDLWNLIKSNYNVESVDQEKYKEFTILTCSPTEDCPEALLTPCQACIQRNSVLRDLLKHGPVVSTY